MFVLSKEMIRKILKGELDYLDDIPWDRENESSKGHHFLDQVRVNLALSKNYVAICRVSEEKCRMKDCPLFVRKLFPRELFTRKLLIRKSGRSLLVMYCREYQIDFPEATFDTRFHVALVGIDKVDKKATKKRLKELKANGANHICLGCKRVYVNKPTQRQENGHGGGRLEMCSCGSDLFDDIDSFIEKL